MWQAWGSVFFFFLGQMRMNSPFFIYRNPPHTMTIKFDPMTDVELTQIEADWANGITWSFAEQRLMATVRALQDEKCDAITWTMFKVRAEKAEAENVKLRECLRIIHECYWSENEPYRERFDELQRMAGEALRSGVTTQ